MPELSIVTWKWSTPNYRSKFTAEHVNALHRMVARHYANPFRFLCVTNDAAGIGPSVQVIPDTEDFKDVRSPHGASAPACFRRLRMFHPDIAQWFSGRFVSLDLDCVITGDMRPVWDRAEDYVGWSDPLRPTQYCGSMTLLSAGARSKVWSEFDPEHSPRAARAAGCMGSDQGWVSHCLGIGEATWGRQDGVYSYRWDLKGGPLPANARVVFFTGVVDPWASAAQQLPWVRENWGCA